MKKAIVLFDTKFGNTEKIAKALALGMEKQEIEVDCVNVENAQIDTLAEYDLVAIGGPTHGFSMSAPMKTFVKKLENLNLKNKSAFAFDTRTGSRFWGSAAKSIEKRLKGIGMVIVKSRSSATVKGLKGPLQEGMEKKFEKIGAELANQ